MFCNLFDEWDEEAQFLIQYFKPLLCCKLAGTKFPCQRQKLFLYMTNVELALLGCNAPQGNVISLYLCILYI